MESQMRTILATIVGLTALAAVSVEAAPLPPANSPAAELGAGPPIKLVAQGCGPGWHRHHWRDYWGRWHWGRCVPNW
jgi:hypothetical protein